MLIKELSNRTGVSIDTIRFYEKQGLLDETHFERSENRYRHYSEQAFNRLQLIKMGQLVGFTLSEMHDTIRAWETDELSPAKKAIYLCRKLEELEQKMKSLNEMRDFLNMKIEELRRAELPTVLK